MNNLTENIENNLVEVFRDTGWQVALVESLLENAEIMAFVHYGGEGTRAPWDSKGCFPLNRIMVSSEDYDKAKEVINQYYQAVKE